MGNTSGASKEQEEQPCPHCGGTGLAHVRVGRTDGDWSVDHKRATAAWLERGARGDSAGTLAPCTWLSCRYHLAFDVNPITGAVKSNFPDIDPAALPVSCVLDVADQNGTTLEETAAIFNLTRERIRQLEVSAVARVRSADTYDTDVIEDMAREMGHDVEAPRRHLRVLR
jgi:hypothetical protein